MLKPNKERGIPEETIKVAKAPFPMGNGYVSLRDRLGTIYEDQTFQDLYPRLGQPAESPGRLALITVMQYLEDRSHRQEAEAVRSQIDWKSMLGLNLEDAGFDVSVLSEFRQRLVQGGLIKLGIVRILNPIRFNVCMDFDAIMGRQTFAINRNMKGVSYVQNICRH